MTATSSTPHSSPPPGATKKEPTEQGDTRPSRGTEAQPRLPHERDESADSQPARESTQDEVGQQALEDLRDGKQNTDRSTESDRVYNRNFERKDEPPRS